jgi:hypothetical protein
VADGTGDATTGPGDEFRPGPAASTVISLSQLVLAPLDALSKAQLHAARSFVNFLLQLGYPERALPSAPAPAAAPPPPAAPGGAPAGDPGLASAAPRTAPEREPEETFFQRLPFDAEVDGKLVPYVARVPTLALVPVRPLAIEEATFKLRMTVSYVGRHRQTKPFERDASVERRPWYLVDDPVSLRGVLAPSPVAAPTRAPAPAPEPGAPEPPGAAVDERSDESTASNAIDVFIKVTQTDPPAGLERLLAMMSQKATISPRTEAGAAPAAAPGGAPPAPTK